jgi:hypothetical protein
LPWRNDSAVVHGIDSHVEIR